MAREHSNAEIFLARRPEVRARVEADDEYTRWKSAVPSLVIDGVVQFFPEGDIQKEEPELIVDFAIRRGLVSPEEVEAEDGGDI